MFSFYMFFLLLLQISKTLIFCWQHLLLWEISSVTAVICKYVLFMFTYGTFNVLVSLVYILHYETVLTQFFSIKKGFENSFI